VGYGPELTTSASRADDEDESMTPRFLPHCCGSRHRSTNAYLRCALGSDFQQFQGDGPYVVLHHFRTGFDRSDRVHAEAFTDLPAALDRLAELVQLHDQHGKCSGTCTGRAYIVTTNTP
jgi:hypothetical protein